MPQRLGQLHHRFGTPYTAVLASAAVMFVSVAFVPVRQVGNLSSLFFLLSFVVVNGAVIKLRRERPNLNRPYEMPFYPAPPILGIVLNLLLGFFIDPSTWLMGLGWLSLGALAYAAVEDGGVVLRWGREPAPDVGPPADGEGEGAAETEDDLSRPTIDPDREGTTERNPDDTGDGIQGPGRGREDQ
jgi:amino acid transporter